MLIALCVKWMKYKRDDTFEIIHTMRNTSSDKSDVQAPSTDACDDGSHEPDDDERDDDGDGSDTFPSCRPSATSVKAQSLLIPRTPSTRPLQVAAPTAPPAPCRETERQPHDADDGECIWAQAVAKEIRRGVGAAIAIPPDVVEILPDRRRR